MKKSTRPHYLIGAALLFIIGCSKPKEPQYLDFQNLHIQKAEMSESVVGADLRYFNPNNFNIQLKKADVDLYINDKYVGHYRLDSLIHIPAMDTFSVPVSIKLNLSDLLKNAFQLLLNPEVRFKIEGNAKLGRSGFYRNFPVSYEGKQRIDVLLRDSSFKDYMK